MGAYGRDPATTRYRFVVHGELDPRRLRSFEFVSIERGGGMTTLLFDVTDSSHLDGIIDRFLALAIDIASVDAVPVATTRENGHLEEGQSWIGRGRFSR